MTSFVPSRPLSLVMGLCLLTGCGSNSTPYRPPLEGVVSWASGAEPRELEGSTIEFETGGAVVATAGLVGDGTFMLIESLPPGDYRVRIQPLASAEGALPAKFKDFEKSGLTYTAPAGAEPQRVNFKLAKAGR